MRRFPPSCPAPRSRPSHPGALGCGARAAPPLPLDALRGGGCTHERAAPRLLPTRSLERGAHELPPPPPAEVLHAGRERVPELPQHVHGLVVAVHDDELPAGKPRLAPQPLKHVQDRHLVAAAVELVSYPRAGPGRTRSTRQLRVLGSHRAACETRARVLYIYAVASSPTHSGGGRPATLRRRECPRQSAGGVRVPKFKS